MDPRMDKLQAEVSALKDKVAALELVNRTAEEKVAAEAAAKEKAAKEAAAKPTFWKKKEPPAGK